MALIWIVWSLLIGCGLSGVSMPRVFSKVCSFWLGPNCITWPHVCPPESPPISQASQQLLSTRPLGAQSLTDAVQRMLWPRGRFPCIFLTWPFSSPSLSDTGPLKSKSQFLNFGLCFSSPGRCWSLWGFNFLHGFTKCYQGESREGCGFNSYAFLFPRLRAQSGCGGGGMGEELERG